MDARQSRQLLHSVGAMLTKAHVSHERLVVSGLSLDKLPDLCSMAAGASFTSVELSYAELDGLRRTVTGDGTIGSAALVTGLDGLKIATSGIDVKRGTVTLSFTAPGIELATQDEKIRWLELLRTLPPLMHPSLNLDIGYGADAACLTSGGYHCDAPPRSGVAINTARGGRCTAGFAHRGDSGAYYLLTSGHCGSRSGWYTRRTNDSKLSLGNSHIVENNAAVDAQIIRMDNFGGALRGWQYKRTNGSSTSVDTFDDTYNISSQGYAVVGTRVCFTGSTSGSHCDEVSQVGASNTSQQNSLVRIEKRVEPGDSGAGVFGSNRAYGIVDSYYCGAFDCDGFYVPLGAVYNNVSGSIRLITE